MTIDTQNIRGKIRRKPDPIALATRGLQTSYEAVNLRITGVKAKVRAGVKARIK